MYSPRRGHAVTVPVHRARQGGGITCCCFFQCCTCVNLNIIRSEPGVIKIAEVLLGLFCQGLALNYGIQYAGTIGPSFQSYITTVSSCLLTSFLLLFCYVFSEKSFHLLKQSLFETAFNSFAAFSYISSCSYLGYAVNMFLHPTYVITPYYQVYPAMSAAYMVGSLLGLIYAYDAYRSYRHLRGFR